jgi:hypothetical protein
MADCSGRKVTRDRKLLQKKDLRMAFANVERSPVIGTPIAKKNQALIGSVPW